MLEAIISAHAYIIRLQEQQRKSVKVTDNKAPAQVGR